MEDDDAMDAGAEAAAAVAIAEAQARGGGWAGLHQATEAENGRDGELDNSDDDDIISENEEEGETGDEDDDADVANGGTGLRRSPRKRSRDTKSIEMSEERKKAKEVYDKAKKDMEEAEKGLEEAKEAYDEAMEDVDNAKEAFEEAKERLADVERHSVNEDEYQEVEEEEEEEEDAAGTGSGTNRRSRSGRRPNGTQAKKQRKLAPRSGKIRVLQECGFIRIYVENEYIGFVHRSHILPPEYEPKAERWEEIHQNVENSKTEVLDFIRMKCRREQNKKGPRRGAVRRMQLPGIPHMMRETVVPMMEKLMEKMLEEDVPDNFHPFISFGGTSNIASRKSQITSIVSDKFGTFARVAGLVCSPKLVVVEVSNIPADMYNQEILNPYESRWIKEGEAKFCGEGDDKFNLWNLEKGGAGSYGLTKSKGRDPDGKFYLYGENF